MSNIVTLPQSAALQKFRRRVKAPHGGRVQVFVKTDTLSPRTIHEFLDFLSLVYGTPIRGTQKDLATTMFTLWLQSRTEVGLRVVCRLYGVDYESQMD